MALALPDLQQAFAAHLLGADRTELADMVASSEIAALSRLSIYRNHVRISLTAALAATYPVVQRLVGEQFFAGAARRFIQEHPPQGPVLTEYGAGFAAHLRVLPSLAELAYVADVARLEWALNVAWSAPRPAPLQPAELASVPSDSVGDLSLRLQPGSALLRSAWPIDHIWHANQVAGDVPEIDLNSGGVQLLVLRRADDAVFANLSNGESAFVETLERGASLQVAADAALAIDPAFAFGNCLARLLGLELFASLSAAEKPA